MKKPVQAQRPRKLTEAQERSLEKLERLAEIHRSSKHFWEKEIKGLDESGLQWLEEKLDRLQQAFMLAMNPSLAEEMIEGESPVNPLSYVDGRVKSLVRTFWFVWEQNHWLCEKGGAGTREGMEIVQNVLRLLRDL